MTDPITGRFGALVLGSWVAEAPTGQDEAFLLLTTPDQRARITMPAVATMLGLTGPPGSTCTDPETRVTVGADGWLMLHTPGGEQFPHPGGDEWRTVARATGRAVLVVGTAPMPPGMAEDAYTDRHGGTAVIGLVPVAFAGES